MARRVVRKRGTSSRTPKAKARRPARPAGVAAPKVTWELVERVREEFEEAAAHVMRESTVAPVDIGPVQELGAAEVDPGVIGWRVSVRAGGSKRDPTQLGELFVLMVPQGGSARVDPEGNPPLHGVKWTEVDTVSLRAGDPTLLLLARPAEPAFRGHLQDLSEQLRAELSAE